MGGSGERPVYFYTVTKDRSVESILPLLYETAGPESIPPFLEANNLSLEDRLRKGRLLIVPAAGAPPSRRELHAGEAADKLSRSPDFAAYADVADVMATLYELLEFVDANAAGGVGALSTAYGNRARHIGRVLKEIEDLYVRTYVRTGTLGGRQFWEARRRLFLELDAALGVLLRPAAVDPSHVKLKRALGLNTRSLLHAWRGLDEVKSVPGFDAYQLRVARLGRHLKALGFLGIGMDAFYSYREIREACTIHNTDRTCTKRRFTEGSRLIGSVTGGVAGGWVASYGICTIALGLPSGGTSAIWCAIVAGGGGALTGGMALGSGAETTAQIVFEKTYPAPLLDR